MKHALAALAVAAAAPAIASSGAARAAEPVLINHWSEPVVERVLQSVGATGLQRTTLDGQAGLIARTADGLSIGVYAKACVDQAAPAEPFCRGIQGLASFDPGHGADRAALAARLNRQYDAGKFTVESDGSIRLTRYIDVDAGVSEANLRSQLASFIALSNAAKEAVWAEPMH